MKPVLYQLEEMSDSREVYDSRPKPFLILFPYFLFFIVLAAAGWAFCARAEETVLALGEIRPAEPEYTVVNPADGTVGIVSYEDGQRVKKGDILYTLSGADRKEQSVKAAADGVVCAKAALSPGEMLPAGKPILRVVPDDGIHYQVSFWIENGDIGRVREGMRVKCTVLSLSGKEAVPLEGEVTRISGDALPREEGAWGGGYRAGARLFGRPPAGLKPGMECRIRIITGEARILTMLIKKLDL